MTPTLPERLRAEADYLESLIPESVYPERRESLRRQVALLREAAEAVDGSCEWTHTDYMWESACGEAWQFNDGGPTENSCRFCQGCGKPLIIATPIDAAGGGV